MVRRKKTVPAPLPPTTSDPEVVAYALLEDWLSPEQLKEFRAHHWFHVTGNITSTRYRIRDYTTLKQHAWYNIDVIESDGTLTTRLCFGPSRTIMEQALPTGDVLLTQKIALERDEEETLRIANVAPFRVDGTPEMYTPPDVMPNNDYVYNTD